MNGYFTDKRPNGKPLDTGTLCWVTEVDGINPIYTYGKSEAEIIEKLSRNQAHAQAALARRASAPQPSSTQPTGPTAAPRPMMTADDIMQATQDLANPAKAGQAVAKLVQHETGVDLAQIAVQNFARMAAEWERETPEFYKHAGNRQLVADRAKVYAGNNLTRVTKPLLTRAFNDLIAMGMLFEGQNEEPAATSTTTPNPPSFPGESPVQRTERPRGTRFATGAPGNRFRAPQSVQAKTLKYTEQEINAMPLSKSRRLIEANDPDYNEACEFYFVQQQAS